MIILSVFDGMSCGQIALSELGYNVTKYYSSEIDKFAIQQTQHNFPNTIQLGSVTEIKAKDLPKIDLLIGGSPCQGFSFAGKQLNFDDPRSALFFEFVRLWKEIKAINPDAKFLLENVNMKKEYMRIISEYMGIFPVNINSNLVSAQNRNRWYWTNIKTKDVGLFDELWSDIPQPEDRGILLKDILQPESEVDKKYYLSNSVTVNLLKHKENQKLKGNGFGVKLHKGNDKFNALKVGGSGVDDIYCVAMRGRNPSKSNDRRTGSPTQQRLEPKTDGKTNCLTSVQKDNLVCISSNQKNATISTDKSSPMVSAMGMGGGHVPMIFKVKEVLQINPSKESGGNQPYQQNRVYNPDGILPALTAELGGRNNILLPEATAKGYKLRRLTPTECSRLQTIPEWYEFKFVSNSQIYRMLGNGWTVDVIKHIFNQMSLQNSSAVAKK